MSEFNYMDLAGKTNNTNYAEIKQRIVDEDIIDAMAFMLTTAQDVSGSLDKLKKLIYYGKEPVESVMAQDEALEIKHDDVLSKLDDPKIIDILHGVLGMYTEAGELIEAIRNHLFKGEELDLVNLSEEVGDCFWYSALIAKNTNKTFEQIQMTNIKKLMKRFPNGFTNEEAKTRDLGSERTILEE